MTSSRKAWARLGERFSGSYRVFAYDQRGHGDSATHITSMSLDRGVQDMLTVAKHVDGDVAGLIGHSWGGAIVVLAGPKSNTLAVIAVDPVLRVMPGTWRADYLDDAESDFAKPFEELALELEMRLSEWPAIDVKGKLHAVRHMTAEPIAQLARDNNVDDGGWNILRCTASYPKPLLVFAAAPGDSVMSKDDVNVLRAGGGTNVEIIEYADQGHNLHRTAFERFTNDVEHFLTRVL